MNPIHRRVQSTISIDIKSNRGCSSPQFFCSVPSQETLQNVSTTDKLRYRTVERKKQITRIRGQKNKIELEVRNKGCEKDSGKIKRKEQNRYSLDNFIQREKLKKKQGFCQLLSSSRASSTLVNHQRKLSFLRRKLEPNLQIYPRTNPILIPDSQPPPQKWKIKKYSTIRTIQSYIQRLN